MTNNTKNIYEWSVDDVACWLDANELSKHKALLCDEHQIDGNSLISLTESDLRKPPVQMTVLGNLYSFQFRKYLPLAFHLIVYNIILLQF